MDPKHNGSNGLFTTVKSAAAVAEARSANA